MGLTHMNNALQSFAGGFRLLNRRLDIFIIYAALGIIGILTAGQIETEYSIFGFIFSLVTTIITISYLFSLPRFFELIQEERKLKYKDISIETLKNTKRMLLSLILVTAALVLLFVGIAIALVLTNTIETVTMKILTPNSPYYPVMLLSFIIPVSLLTFAPVFFSLENTSFIVSLKRSFLFSLKNGSFFAVVILITSILVFINFNTYSIDSSFSPAQFILTKQPLWLEMARVILGAYFNLVITASAFIYYQKHKVS